MVNSTTNTSSSLNLDHTFGALYIGVLFSAILFGFSCIQVFIYFQTHWQNAWFGRKAICSYLWVVDAFHLAIISQGLYYYLVTNYDKPSALNAVVWEYQLQIVITVLVMLSVHCLYVHYIWVLSYRRKRSIFTVVSVVIVMTTGISLYLCYDSYTNSSSLMSNLGELALPLAIGSVALTDFLIAVSMCYLLTTSMTGFTSTDKKLRAISIYVISSGSLTSLVSIVVFITYKVMHNMVYLAAEVLLTRLYVNSFMAMMNAEYYQNGREELTSTVARQSTFGGALHHRVAFIGGDGNDSKESQSEEASSSVPSRHPRIPSIIFPRCILQNARREPVEVTIALEHISRQI